MLHAPTSESKKRSAPARTKVETQREHELFPRLGGSSHREHSAGLQSTIGNQAVLRMLVVAKPQQKAGNRGVLGSRPAISHTGAPVTIQRKCAACEEEGKSTVPLRIQPKLHIGAVDDPLEREADRVADTLMRMPDPAAAPPTAVLTASPRVQRKCACGGTCSKCQAEQSSHGHEALQMKSAGPGAYVRTSAAPMVHEVLRSPGRPLDAATRAFMEPRFGRDFGEVRIHTDGRAAESAQSVNARAYASGHDVVFGQGQYATQGPQGRSLLAHELAHVAQQTQGRSSGLQRAPALEGQKSFHESAASAIDKVIAASFITTYVPKKELKTLAGNVQVLNPSDYEVEYKRWGKSKEDVFNVPGFTDREAKRPIKLRSMGKDKQGRGNYPSTVEDAVHETVHLNSKMQFQTNFTHNYNEGVTQYFTEKVLGEAGAAYRHEVKLAEGLIKLLGKDGEDLVAKAFFNGAKEPFLTILHGFMQDPDKHHKADWEAASQKDPPDWQNANQLLDKALKFATAAGRATPAPAAATSPSPPAIQKKLTINEPGDPFEQEADRVANQVMRMPDPSPALSRAVPEVQRKCSCGGSCDQCQSDQEHKPLQMKHLGTGDLGRTEATPVVHEVLRSPGRPLDFVTRAFMEPRFGLDPAESVSTQTTLRLDRRLRCAP